jgi:hypothetical protein
LRSWVENELGNKRCLILLSGFDEAADTEVRKKAARWVEERIDGIAVNPLLLTMITTVHKECNSLPGRRVELYREICDVLLGKRRASQPLAGHMKPADFFTGVRDDSDLMIEPEKDEYAFAHLTFQEYLASSTPGKKDWSRSWSNM